MGWFTSEGRMRQPSMSRAVFLLVGAAAYAFTEFGRFVVRPWVRETGFNDLGLTDTVGNWGGTVVQIFLACAIFNPNRRQSFRIAAFYAAGYVVYEFVQPMLPKGVFDWGDVVGTGVGYLISLLILLSVWRGTESEPHRPKSAQAEGTE